MRAGNIQAAAYNVHRAKSTDKIWTWTDFYADPNAKPKEAQPDERILSGFETINQIMQAEMAAKRG